MIINGTIYFVTQFDQVFALNAANGNVLWTDVLPLTANSTAGTAQARFHSTSTTATCNSRPSYSATPDILVAADDQKVYAINALNGKYELNFSVFTGSPP